MSNLARFEARRRVRQLAFKEKVLTCKRCKQELPLTEFRVNLKLATGYDSYCRACHVAATRAWRSEHLDAINARRRQNYAKAKEEAQI